MEYELIMVILLFIIVILMIYKMFYMNDCKYDNIMPKPNKNNYKQ